MTRNFKFIESRSRHKNPIIQYNVFDDDGCRVANIEIQNGRAIIKSLPIGDRGGCHSETILDWKIRGCNDLRRDEKSSAMEIFQTVINHHMDSFETVKIGEIYLSHQTVYPDIFRVVGIEKMTYCGLSDIKGVRVEPLGDLLPYRSSIEVHDNRATVIPYHIFSEQNFITLGSYGAHITKLYDKNFDNLEKRGLSKYNYSVRRDDDITRIISKRPCTITCENTDSTKLILYYTMFDRTITRLSYMYPDVETLEINDCGYIFYNPLSVVQFAKLHDLRIGSMSFQSICNVAYQYLIKVYGEVEAFEYYRDGYVPSKEDYNAVVIDDYCDDYNGATIHDKEGTILSVPKYN